MNPALARPHKTLADLRALPDETPAELIRGELYVTPAPSERHQSACLRIASILLSYARASGLLRAYVAPFDVFLPSGDVVEPDALLVSAGSPGLRQDGFHGVPELAVEIVSPGHPLHDRVVKRDLYASNGVPEYWIVDPEEKTIEILRLDGQVYAPAGYGTGTQVLASPTFSDLSIPLARIFD